METVLTWKQVKSEHGPVHIGLVDGKEVARVEKVSTCFRLSLDGSIHPYLSAAMHAAVKLLRVCEL